MVVVGPLVGNCCFPLKIHLATNIFVVHYFAAFQVNSHTRSYCKNHWSATFQDPAIHQIKSLVPTCSRWTDFFITCAGVYLEFCDGHVALLHTCLIKIHVPGIFFHDAWKHKSSASAVSLLHLMFHWLTMMHAAAGPAWLQSHVGNNLPVCQWHKGVALSKDQAVFKPYSGIFLCMFDLQAVFFGLKLREKQSLWKLCLAGIDHRSVNEPPDNPSGMWQLYSKILLKCTGSLCWCAAGLLGCFRGFECDLKCVKTIS